MTRSRHEIAADILKVAQKGAIKTRIVYGANLNFEIIKKYLEKLTSSEMLRQEGRRYYTTEKGVDFIGLVDAIRGA